MSTVDHHLSQRLSLLKAHQRYPSKTPRSATATELHVIIAATHDERLSESFACIKVSALSKALAHTTWTIFHDGTQGYDK
jgi:hypothetical protein